MHTRDFFYDNYKNHPEHVLTRIAGDYKKLTPVAQEALRDVLRERKMDELLASLEKEDKKKGSLSHLTPDEVRAMINARLDQGEKIDFIKADLRDRGVNVFDLSLQESKQEEAIEERFIQLQKEGKSKNEIDQALKKEFNLPGKDAAKIPEKMYSNGSWLIVVGAVLLMVTLPMLLVLVQDRRLGADIKLPAAGVVAGVILLFTGIRKRMVAQKFIKQAGGES